MDDVARVSSYLSDSFLRSNDLCPSKPHEGVSVSTILGSAAQIGIANTANQGDSFQVSQEQCAIVIRNLPPNTTENELTMFVQRRIQLAFKEQIGDSAVVACHVYNQGGQAAMEFQDRRIAIRALSLRNKYFKGGDLEFLPWKKRPYSPPHGETMDSSCRNHRSSTNGNLDAVYVSNLPKNVSSDQLKFFLTEMMKVAYKDIPNILSCNVYPGRDDAYVLFENGEQANRAINLRNRVFEGKQLKIIAWDPRFLCMDWSGDEATKQSYNSPDELLSTASLPTQEDRTKLNDMNAEKIGAAALAASAKVVQSSATIRDPQSSRTGTENLSTLPSMASRDENNDPCNDNRMANILKRQLDAMRLDRDHWKCAHDESQALLQEATAELASARAKIPVQHDKNGESSEGLLQAKLADAEQRFCQVAQSLAEQTNTLNAVIQENLKLKARLDEK